LVPVFPIPGGQCCGLQMTGLKLVLLLIYQQNIFKEKKKREKEKKKAASAGGEGSKARRNGINEGLVR
jgi:hypothetical protein